MKKKYYERVKGTSDLYFPQSGIFQDICRVARDHFSLCGYEEIILPVLEEKGLFIRGVGKATDIVQKQMFKIEGRDIVLRPEGTAQAVRFYLENSLHKQRDFHKFFYIGPMFRGENPQKGRLRQFHHAGCEVFGSDSPYLDAEIIALAVSIINDCGIKNIRLKINSIGCPEDKEKLKVLLRERLKGCDDRLCPLCVQRIRVNPLRVLDCKRQTCRKVVESLDLGDSYLCSGCSAHFREVREVLDSMKVGYEYDPLLVRGLDYYTNTVFEFLSSELGAQSACGAGGRYNDLVNSLGGPCISAVGFALGIERMMLLLKEKEHKKLNLVRVFVAYTDRSLYSKAYEILRELRNNRIGSEISYRDKSLKSQFRYAEKIGAGLAVIVGEEEIKNNCVILRDMNESTQEKVQLQRIVDLVRMKDK